MTRSLWKQQPNEWRKRAWSRGKWTVFGGIAALSVGGIVYYGTHLQKTPITERQRFVMFSREQAEILIESSEVIAKMIQEQGPELPPSHELYQVVASVTSRIIQMNRGAEMEGFKWNLHVVDNPNVVNAMCLPSGEIYVFTGLVHECRNHNELALILSHEIAHAVLGHGIESLSNTAIVDFLYLFVIGLIWSIIPGFFGPFLLHSTSEVAAVTYIKLPYSRMLETEADLVGLMMSSRACYDPTVAIELWKHLGVTSAPGGPTGDVAPTRVTIDKPPTSDTSDNASARVTPGDAELEDQLEWFSTHPTNAHRHEHLTSLLPEAQLVYEESGCKVYKAEKVHFTEAFRQLFKIKS